MDFRSYWLGCLLLWTLNAGAHVVVTPAEAGIGKFQRFMVGVPAERSAPTLGVRLLIPAGVKSVLPNVKPGWQIEVKMNAQGAAAEIEWSGGTIPAGQRDDFVFSAKLPANETILAWKAYQRYGDGSIVAWDRDPKAAPLKNEAGTPEFSKAGPWSQTRVIDDLKRPGIDPDLSVWMSGIALAVALAALLLAWTLWKELHQVRAGAASDKEARSSRRY